VLEGLRRERMPFADPLFEPAGSEAAGGRVHIGRGGTCRGRSTGFLSLAWC
jgi:hypothetical protein